VSAACALAVALVARHHNQRAELPTAMTLVAVWNGLYAARLIRLALAWRRIMVSDQPFDQPLDRAGRPGAGRRTGLLGLGLAATALTCAFVVVLRLRLDPENDLSVVAAAGIAATAVPFAAALFALPGAAADPVARLRRALDAVSVGICLLFTSWVLIIAPEGRIDSVGFWIAILTCCLLSLMVLTVLRAGPTRRIALYCGGAVAATVIGLNGIASALAGDLPSGWTWLFTLLLLAAPLLAWAGTTAATEPVEPVVEYTPTFAGYPVLAVPAAAAIGVALHHLIVGNAFDRPSVLLGVVGITVVAIRETLGAFDVARYARRVVDQEAQFRNLVAGSSDVIMVLDTDLVVRWQSPASARQFGLSDQDVVGRHFQSMIHPADAAAASARLETSLFERGGLQLVQSTGCRMAELTTEDLVRASLPSGDRPNLIEARLRDGFGRWRETESSVSDQRHVPEVGGLVLHIRDVGERKELERAMHQLTYADQLTGLANRRQVLRTITSLRTVSRVGGAILLIELDGFTAVNDVRGYEIGDAVLVEVARRLRTGAGGSDLAARLSGDEFAIVTEAPVVRAYALATRLVTMLAEPIALPGVTVHLSASVGMTDLSGGANSDEVLRRADLALRRAKQLGRGRVEWYDAAVEEALLRRMTLEQELPSALDRGELDLIYQPILDLVAGRPLAVEALLRWRHPRLGTLLPADVIPVAEDLGLIGTIGGWVLQQATRQLSAWLREGRDLSIAVNISPRQFEVGLTDEVGRALSRYQLPPERLVVELAEWGLAAETESVTECLGELRGRGVRTALDDFGTAPDSLTHLRQLPMDMVKIGRSFFDGPGPRGGALQPALQPALPGLTGTAAPARPRAGRSTPIIDVMVGLSRRLGLEVVAQGLEEPAHLSVVRGAGCRLGQGHLFAHPQPAERIEAYLDRFPSR
jgi:diguanylate cyclase (GGDEF)-like protein